MRNEPDVVPAPCPVPVWQFCLKPPLCLQQHCRCMHHSRTCQALMLQMTPNTQLFFLRLDSPNCVKDRLGRTSRVVEPRSVCPAIDRVYEAAGVDWDIEEVSRLRVERPVWALQQHFMQCRLYLHQKGYNQLASQTTAHRTRHREVTSPWSLLSKATQSCP